MPDLIEEGDGLVCGFLHDASEFAHGAHPEREPVPETLALDPAQGRLLVLEESCIVKIQVSVPLSPLPTQQRGHQSASDRAALH